MLTLKERITHSTYQHAPLYVLVFLPTKFKQVDGFLQNVVSHTSRGHCTLFIHPSPPPHPHGCCGRTTYLRTTLTPQNHWTLIFVKDHDRRKKKVHLFFSVVAKTVVWRDASFCPEKEQSRIYQFRVSHGFPNARHVT